MISINGWWMNNYIDGMNEPNGCIMMYNDKLEKYPKHQNKAENLHNNTNNSSNQSDNLDENSYKNSC